MPQLGLTMTEGKVLQWYKKVGDSFKVGEPLYEVETDKVNMDAEATESGELTEIVGPLDEVLPIKTVIARFARAGEPAVAATPAAPAQKSRQAVSPRARKLAETNHVDLSRVKGTGPGGRIVESDASWRPCRREHRRPNRLQSPQRQPLACAPSPPSA